MGNEVACARGRGVVFALALLTNNSVFLFRAKILRKPAIGRSNHVPPKNQLRAHFHWGENIAFCFARQLVAVQIVFWAARHGSFSLLVFLCVLYSLFIKLDCQLLQDSIGGFVFCSASSNRSSFPQKLKVASRKQEFFDDQSKYPSCITARGTVSVPLQHGSDQWSAASFSSLIAALHAWCMFFLLQCLWWTSAVSRPSALSLCIWLVCLSFG